MAGLENFSTETSESIQKTQNENFDSQVWSPDSGKLRDIRAQGDKESKKSRQEADDLLNSIENPQDPPKRVLLTSLLSPEEIEERKDEKLWNFSRWIQVLLRDDMSEERKQEFSDNIVWLLGSWCIIYYKDQKFSVQDLYDKINDGTVDITWDKVWVKGSVYKYANVIKLPQPDWTETIIPGILFQDITIFDSDADIDTERHVK